MLNNIYLYDIFSIFIIKNIIMKKYALKNKSGDIISTISANSFEEAIELFCFRKKFDRYTLLHLFDVAQV
jgi:hypothetical protein